ncbi:hypothetical protein BKA70DRAFT_1371062 [Coprinopsis sp. MPI-PUGE-AT-0042]|nr:hypothetical protein BKA70DRAFT_1371062 [Coprinopsis sp. MPI-PUGE-AT-0042]
MGVLIFDDRDASVVYSGSWGQAGVSEEFNSTTTFSNTAGSTATLNFIGTGITVLGTIAGGAREEEPISQYVLDDNDAVLFQGSPGRAPQRNQAFYQSPTLPAGQHTLTITNLAEGTLFLDLMIVTPVEEVVVSTVTTTATRVAPNSATSVLTVTSLRNAPSASAAAGSSPGSAEDAATSSGAVAQPSKTNAGAIAGGIIGGILLLLLLTFGFIFFRKRQQKKRKAPSESYWTSPNVNPAPITPFPPPAQPASPQMSQQGYDSYPSQYQQYPQTNQYASQYPQSVNEAPSELAYDTGDYYSTYPSSAQPAQYAPPSSNMPSSGMGNNGRTRVNLNG